MREIPVTHAILHAASVLRFWFEDCTPRQWFAKDGAFDAQVRHRFGGLVEQALAGDLTAWGCEAESALALVLLLDQFIRQIWRGEARAFAGDAEALRLSLAAEAQGWLEQEPAQPRRQFWLMPRMHAEDLDIQDAALPLFARFPDPRTHAVAQRHRDVIARFGRFPHRNAALGRTSTSVELEFLRAPSSVF